MSIESKLLKDSYYRYLRYFLAKDDATATAYDKYMALAYAVRSELVDNWIKTQGSYHTSNIRRVYYLSMEYIFGKSLNQNQVNLGLESAISTSVEDLGLSLDDLYRQEDDFELGNAGKGRMAACMLESMATLGIPALAYGLRYDYSQFQQDIKNGTQAERPYDYLHRGHPWEIVRPEYACSINFAGDCRQISPTPSLGPYEWRNAEQIHAVPYDVPIPGYRNQTVNTLRLWSARASEEFLPDYANHGDYVRACEEKSQLGRITKVLFPEEDVRRATDLRLKQQFFFVSAAIQDIIRRYKVRNDTMLDFDKKVVIQINGSRCALAIAELMRILVDIERVPWDKAWEITSNVFAYTSHAVLRDNLEIWPVYKLNQVLPRHMHIIFDLNQIHLERVREKFGSDTNAIRELSLIEEGEVKRIRLADLAVVGSFSVNGVSREQAEIVKKRVFPHFSLFFSDKFNNKTSGVAHRRWLLCSNRELADLISGTIGDSWIRDPMRLIDLEKHASDKSLLESLVSIRLRSKKRLAERIRKELTIAIDPMSFFDVQCRKIHPVKRQVLHLLNILHRYEHLKNGGTLPCRRVHIFAGKASPSDFLAKQIIHLINLIANLVNNDPIVKETMTVLFIPNFGMSWAEQIVSATDLSEQLPTAGQEPAGTFNLKFAFNGSVTIASRAGTNIEMIEHLGEENIFAFGKTAEELSAYQDYRPSELLSKDPRLKSVFALIENLIPKVADGHAIYPLLSSLRDSDRQFVLLDFDDYLDKQRSIDSLCASPSSWARVGLMNIARIGWFSTDRMVSEYARDTWKVTQQ